MLVEIFRKNFLASIVPVIVNAVLNHHHVVVDIVAFVAKGDFPRSRLGEKQRGKILASWVTRKLRTIAQFGIRDPDGGFAADIEDKNGSRRISSMSSAQQVSSVQHRNSQPRSQTFGTEYATELPTQHYQDSIPELPAHGSGDEADELADKLGELDDMRSDDTPTGVPPSTGTPATWSNHSRAVSNELSTALDYSPIDQRGPFSNDTDLEQFGSVDPVDNLGEIPLPLRPASPPAPPPPPHGEDAETEHGDPPSPSWSKKPFPSPEAEGKEVYGGRHAPVDYEGKGFGEEDDDWKKEAGMYMNFTGSGPGSLEYGR